MLALLGVAYRARIDRSYDYRAGDVCVSQCHSRDRTYSHCITKCNRTSYHLEFDERCWKKDTIKCERFGREDDAPQANCPTGCLVPMYSSCTDKSAPHYTCVTSCMKEVRYKSECDNLPSGKTKCVYWKPIYSESKPRYDFDNAKSITKFVV